MSRSDDDTWDITTGVGLTAVTIAASRAIETAADQPLIDDPYAALLIDGDELRPLMDQYTAMQANSAALKADMRALVDYHAARTRFFDDYLRDAGRAGICQYVILASGLDSRAFRLEWSPDSRVFEVDQPSILDYKARTLKLHDAEPRARWSPVGADLRSDWSLALQNCGFNPGLPTAWLAEGLLPFLSGGDQDRLFDTIQLLSARGSRLATEAFNVTGGSLLETIDREAGRPGVAHGDEASPMKDLWYGDEGRSNPVEWWSDRGWRVDAARSVDYLLELGRPVGASGSFAALSTFVTGVKP